MPGAGPQRAERRGAECWRLAARGNHCRGRGPQSTAASVWGGGWALVRAGGSPPTSIRERASSRMPRGNRVGGGAPKARIQRSGKSGDRRCPVLPGELFLEARRKAGLHGLRFIKSQREGVNGFCWLSSEGECGPERRGVVFLVIKIVPPFITGKGPRKERARERKPRRKTMYEVYAMGLPGKFGS